MVWQWFVVFVCQLVEVVEREREADANERRTRCLGRKESECRCGIVK